MLGISAFIRHCREKYRAFFRRHTRRMSVYEAEEKKLFWSKLYAIFSLMALFSVTWSTATGAIPNKPIPPLFGSSDSYVYRIPFKKKNSVANDGSTQSSESETTGDDSHSEKS